MGDFAAGRIDAVYVGFMNFISTGVQRPDVLPLLPLGALKETIDNIAKQISEKEEQSKRGALDDKTVGIETTMATPEIDDRLIYEFSPAPKELLDELIPLAVKTAFFQTYLDAATSEHVSRMVAMKAATDNAEEMARALSLQYNRARQSQITTELSEIMGGVEAMKS
jgi:F-type H+-transporting ATPase subunit gamma